MNIRKVDWTIRNVVFYLIGLVFIAIGVVMMTKSDIGNSSWDTLHWSLHQKFDFSMGVATIIVASFFTIIVVAINKDISLLGMLVPIFTVGFSIDFLNTLLNDFVPISLYVQIPIYIVGCLILPFGGSLLIISTFPAGIFDELNLTLMRMFKSTNLSKVRVIMEILAVLTAILIGYSAGIGLGKVKIGTLIFSVSVGTILRTYLKIFERIGYYENKQID